MFMPIIEYNDEYFMREAIKEARQALEEDEVPIGCVIVCNNTIIARAHNMIQRLKDSTAHAEMIAITAAEEYLHSKYLKDCTLYVTLEPCIMCAGAMLWAQIPRVVYGADDEKRGAFLYGFPYYPTATIDGGVLEEECKELVKDFFRKKRKK